MSELEYYKQYLAEVNQEIFAIRPQVTKLEEEIEFITVKWNTANELMAKIGIDFIREYARQRNEKIEELKDLKRQISQLAIIQEYLIEKCNSLQTT